MHGLAPYPLRALRWRPGAVLLLDDTIGKGHDLRVLGDEYLQLAVVSVAD